MSEQPTAHVPQCFAVSATLAGLGDKWTVLLVLLLRDGTRRFGELKRLVPGISPRMLTVTLRTLERDGLVKRTLFPSVPPRVDYELTALGLALSKPLEILGAWAIENEQQITDARREFDARLPAGN